MICPLSKASISSRRSQPAKRICFSCESSAEGHTVKLRAYAEDNVKASVTKRKMSSLFTSSQTGKSISPSLRPLPAPSEVSLPVGKANGPMMVDPHDGVQA